MLRKNKPIIVALVLAALLAGCAQTPDPGVRLRSVSTDLGLGLVKDIRKETLPELPPLGEFPEPPYRPGPGGPPVPTCPQAGLFEFADVEAGPTISGVPAMGSYRWKYKLNVIDPEKAQPFIGGANRFILTDDPRKGIIEFFASRTVHSLNPDLIEAGTTIATDRLQRGSFQFTYQEGFGISPWPTIHNLGGGDRFRVQPASYADTSNTQRDEGEGVTILFTAWAESQNVRDPRSQKVWLSPWAGPSVGGPVNPNSPTDTPQAGGPFLKLIHFPVTAGQTITSVAHGQAVDPSVLGGNPNAVTNMGPKYDVLLEGKVIGRRQVDACGEMVDGWYVDAKITLIRDGGTPLVMDYDYEIAPQMGGMIIYQRWAMQSEPLAEYTAQKPAFVIEASIASAKPL